MEIESKYNEISNLISETLEIIDSIESGKEGN